jgi:hypothetical protein
VRNCCPLIGVAADEFTSSFCLLTSCFPGASFQTHHSDRRLRARCADARFDRPRSKAGRLPGLSAPLWPGRSKRVAPHQRQCAHNCRCNRTLQKRRAYGAYTFAASTTHRDDCRSCHRYPAPSCSLPLAKVMRTIVERRLRLPGRRCACPTNSALTLEYAELGAANVRQLDERKRSTNCESFLRVWAGNHKTGSK